VPDLEATTHTLVAVGCERATESTAPGWVESRTDSRRPSACALKASPITAAASELPPIPRTTTRVLPSARKVLRRPSRASTWPRILEATSSHPNRSAMSGSRLAGAPNNEGSRCQIRSTIAAVVVPVGNAMGARISGVSM
jgi:hypothetical protein